MNIRNLEVLLFQHEKLVLRQSWAMKILRVTFLKSSRGTPK